MERKSSHILNASSNLLGFCLVIITSLKVTRYAHGTYIDEATGIASLCLAASCIFSFLAIRTGNRILQPRYEKLADYLFLTALIFITVSVLFLSIIFL